MKPSNVTGAQMSARTSSITERGPTKGVSRSGLPWPGRGRALRSILPLGNFGNEPILMNAEGIM